jgi:ATP-binding cassette subfamily B protein
MKKKKNKYFRKALIGGEKYTLLTPLMMVGEVAMECLIPLIMAYLVDFLNILKIDDAISLSAEQISLYVPSISMTRINIFVNLAQHGFSGLGIIFFNGLIILFASLFSLLFGVLGASFAAKAGGIFAKNLRNMIFENIQTLSFENLDKYQTSSLVTRLTTDVTNLQDAFVMIIRTFVRAPIMFVISFVMCLNLKVQLTSIFVIAVPILIFALLLIVSKVHSLFMRLFKTYDKMNERVQENLIGIRVVKSFVREDFEIEKFKKTNSLMRDIGIRAEKILVWNSPIMSFVMYLCIFLVCFIGGKYFVVGDSSMTLGSLQAYLTYIQQILSSLMTVAMMFVNVVMSKASKNRIEEILNEKSTLTNPASPIYQLDNGDIEFKNVSFSYSSSLDNLNLQDCSFKIKSGQMIGIIGGTGSSKTTLVSLISRLYDVTSGEVLIADHNIKDYDLTLLRNKIAVVLQKNVLFSGSIRENMKWGKEDASDEEIIEALKNAQAYDFVSSLSDGLDYDLGQGGVNVSGGQKQRLCIARALLKDPKILILDDSTSAVDTKTDALIRDSLRNNLPHITKIIIAQRIASVQDADNIIVLNEGKIDGIGTHEQLIKNNKIYQEVYTSQTKKGDE